MTINSIRTRAGRVVSATNNWKARRANTRKLPHAEEQFRLSYSKYWQGGVVPPSAQTDLFLATWASGGTFPRSLATSMSPSFDLTRADKLPNSVLSGLNPAHVADAVTKNGYYVWNERLSDDLVDSIKAHMDAGPADPRGDAVRDIGPGAPAPTAPTWWMQPRYTIQSEPVQQLLHEQNLISSAAAYLGSDPVLASMIMWTSFAWPLADSTSAQLFHYDLDRSNFIKMFVYLTDVDDTNGPHVYVPNSHHSKPKELLSGERITDARVREHFPESTWQTITGKKGTVFFADTQGFHKGARVEAGSRTILQFNLASDRFGYEPAPPIGDVSEIPNTLLELAAAYPRFFSQLYKGSSPIA